MGGEVLEERGEPTCQLLGCRTLWGGQRRTGKVKKIGEVFWQEVRLGGTGENMKQGVLLPLIKGGPYRYIVTQ